MARRITSVAVFCGSNTGEGDSYVEGARVLGAALARRGITLVYGGTHKGLMGVLADAVLSGGGTAHGVITERLHGKGHLHPGLSLHEIVETMRLRKERMLEVADACIALPGGIGTVEEFMEAWTLNQLGEIDKPVGLLNVAGYYDPFMGFIDSMIDRRFLPAAHRESIMVNPDPDGLIDALESYERITVPKWM